MLHGDASEAYRRAYNTNAKPDTVKAEAQRLLNNPHVAPTIEALLKRVAEIAEEKFDIKAEDILQEIAAVAFYNAEDSPPEARAAGPYSWRSRWRMTICPPSPRMSVRLARNSACAGTTSLTRAQSSCRFRKPTALLLEYHHDGQSALRRTCVRAPHPRDSSTGRRRREFRYLRTAPLRKEAGQSRELMLQV